MATVFTREGGVGDGMYVVMMRESSPREMGTVDKS